MTITPDDLHDHPLLTTADMVGRIEDLLAPGINPGQLWVLFLDARRRQLPAVMPIERVPVLPDGTVLGNLARALRSAGPGFAWVIFVLERLGSDGVTGVDRRWAAALRTATAKENLSVAGIFVMTPDTVKAIPG